MYAPAPSVVVMPPRPPPSSTHAAEKTASATLVPSAERKRSMRQKVAPSSGSPLAGVNRRTTYDTDHLTQIT